MGKLVLNLGQKSYLLQVVMGCGLDARIGYENRTLAQWSAPHAPQLRADVRFCAAGRE